MKIKDRGRGALDGVQVCCDDRFQMYREQIQSMALNKSLHTIHSASLD